MFEIRTDLCPVCQTGHVVKVSRLATRLLDRCPKSGHFCPDVKRMSEYKTFENWTTIFECLNIELVQMSDTH